jgi:hypothetical protein
LFPCGKFKGTNGDDDVFPPNEDFRLMMVFLMMKTLLLEKSLIALIVLRVMMIFLQVNIFMEDPMTLVRMVIIFLVSLILLLSTRLSMKMMMDLGMKIMFSIIQLKQIKVIDIILFGFLKKKLYDIPSSDEENPSSDDYEIMETLQRNIVSRTRTRPFYINPNDSSYTRSRK